MIPPLAIGGRRCVRRSGAESSPPSPPLPPCRSRDILGCLRTQGAKCYHSRYILILTLFSPSFVSLFFGPPNELRMQYARELYLRSANLLLHV